MHLVNRRLEEGGGQTEGGIFILIEFAGCRGIAE